jgi:hypothetical protein
MSHGAQCPCCAGTDVAHQMGQPCYAEYLQQQQAEEEAYREAEWESYVDDARPAVEAIIAFARAFA